MGKEIKIGLGVIAVLLVVFVVVLVVRLTSPRGDSPPLAEAGEPSPEAKDHMTDKLKPAPAPKPAATRVVAEKPQIAWGKSAKYPSSKHANRKNRDAAANGSAQPMLQPLATAADQPREQAGWAMAGDPNASASALQSGSSTFVLDPPPGPPRGGAAATVPPAPTPTGAPLEYPSDRLASQRYDRQRDNPRELQRPAASPQPLDYRSRDGGGQVYQNVSTTRGAAATNSYGDYRGNFGGRSQYGGQYPATSPPPVSPGSFDGSRGDGAYEVQPNDSYWQISARIYGNGAYFKALAEHNRNEHPLSDRLRVGDVISTPSLSELVDRYADLCPSPQRQKTMEKRSTVMGVLTSSYGGGSSYSVQDGDTLYDIARYELGDASRWVEILELNRQTLQGDFDYLSPGMKLIMPRESSDRITQRPGSHQPASQNKLLR